MARYIVDVNESNFQIEVIERSKQVPVVVDFWAPWCAPCQLLKPILEKLAIEAGGAFILSRLNTEENPNIAMFFNITSIPNVKIFKDGGVVDGFVGALPEPSIRAIVSKYAKTEIDKLLEKAKNDEKVGKYEDAKRIYTTILDMQPVNTRAKLSLAKILLREKNVDKAEGLIASINDDTDELRNIKSFIEFVKSCGKEGNRDLDKKYSKAACLALKGEYEDALRQLLEIVMKDRSFKNEGARKAMVNIFNILGDSNKLTKDYRKKLAMALF
ncbi:MAG: hypothetical protein AMJ45_04220 [Syntrophobacter sp. DG_60]|nr:MAG: hypothetical protein AMJ45_04220 [Syntrophobacter sp. DG_60]